MITKKIEKHNKIKDLKSLDSFIDNRHIEFVAEANVSA